MAIDFKDGIFYFAHPYSCYHDDGRYNPAGEEANFRLCCIRTAKLIERGYLIYSPIAHTHPIHISYPPFVGNNIHKMWYEFDNKFIEQLPFKGIILRRTGKSPKVAGLNGSCLSTCKEKSCCMMTL